MKKPCKKFGASPTLSKAPNNGSQNITKSTPIIRAADIPFLGGAHAAARLDWDVDDPLPPPTLTRPLVDTLTPLNPLLPFRVPPDQTMLSVLVLDELQLGQFDIFPPMKPNNQTQHPQRPLRIVVTLPSSITTTNVLLLLA